MNNSTDFTARVNDENGMVVVTANSEKAKQLIKTKIMVSKRYFNYLTCLMLNDNMDWNTIA